ncbi:hypothetical protein Ddye_012834 [Dipteronia dyeriana]|uniref:Transcription repressor n=1 Tax=Dipteronia dyeriana TaxID=168575 RepID=A0AAE0CJM2_9ROSI|nr:hypothetical protein Ddye_012834 [Dipteronia dyeriana]
MGNYRFRFSDMMPNAWFYKLKDMSRTKTHPVKKKSQPKKPVDKSHNKPNNISQPRYSYYLTSQPINSLVNRKASDTHFPDSSTRKSTSRRNNSRRRTVYKPSPRHFSSSDNCTCQAKFQQYAPDYCFISSSESSLGPGESPLCYSEEEFVDPNHDQVSWSDSCNCEVTSSTTDIIIDINSNETITQKVERLAGFHPISEFELPPIFTKPAKFTKSSEQVSVKIVKEGSVRTQKQYGTTHVIRKSSSNSTGIKLRANSPRIASKKIPAYSRKSISLNMKYGNSQKRSLSESFIVVKSSIDPQKDFRDSMEEMIMENNIRNSKDLEDLLACYLSLNSNEYHDLIVKAFEQIWFDMTNLSL